MPAIARSGLAADLRAVGLRPGAIAMVHTRMSALGWVVGGAETVVRALLEALGPEGTLMAYASWAEHVYDPEDWPAEHRAAYVAEPPLFDPATAEVDRGYGRIPERIRTWPGARHSGHPEGGVVAVGAQAEWVTEEQPADDAYGARSPFARLVASDGQLLLLGAPLDTLTLLHHAEGVARVGGKRRRTFRVATPGGERSYTDIDTEHGAFPYETLGLGEDAFAAIGRSALAAGVGTTGRVGEAECRLFPARDLTAFGVDWMERRFG
jgi:aminoglycoside 3-N-acetyltransferase